MSFIWLKISAGLDFIRLLHVSSIFSCDNKVYMLLSDFNLKFVYWMSTSSE